MVLNHIMMIPFWLFFIFGTFLVLCRTFESSSDTGVRASPPSPLFQIGIRELRFFHLFWKCFHLGIQGKYAPPHILRTPLPPPPSISCARHCLRTHINCGYQMFIMKDAFFCFGVKHFSDQCVTCGRLMDVSILSPFVTISVSPRLYRPTL